MSRTDVHRPYRVWLADHPELAIAIHRHNGSVCDLPDDRAAVGTRCRWELPPHTGPKCSCSLCGGGPWHKADVRKRRQRDRTFLRRRPVDLDAWAELEATLLHH